MVGALRVRWLCRRGVVGVLAVHGAHEAECVSRGLGQVDVLRDTGLSPDDLKASCAPFAGCSPGELSELTEESGEAVTAESLWREMEEEVEAWRSRWSEFSWEALVDVWTDAGMLIATTTHDRVLRQPLSRWPSLGALHECQRLNLCYSPTGTAVMWPTLGLVIDLAQLAAPCAEAAQAPSPLTALPEVDPRSLGATLRGADIVVSNELLASNLLTLAQQLERL